MARATCGTVVLADVDDLKAINDHYGHATGDRVLRHCVEVLRAALRPYDKPIAGDVHHQVRTQAAQLAT